MSAEESGKSEMGHQGLRFATTLSDCLLSGLIIIDGSRKIESLSDGAAKILDLDSNAAVHQPCEVLPAPLQEIIAEVSRSGHGVSNRKVDLPHNEQFRTLQVSAALIQSSAKLAAIALVIEDFDCAPFLDQNFRQLDRLASAGTLAASMAHEIRNALVAGKTFIDLLLEKNQDAELVEIVRREYGRIDSIVSQMLKFAAPAKPLFSSVRLHDTLDHSLRLVQSRLQSGAITLHRFYEATPDLISGDDYQLEQAFVNLLLNAAEAMGPHGELFVSTQLGPGQPANGSSNGAGQHMRITIRDTGAGITPEHMQRLFEPFFTTKPNGTGLGLLITRRIIQEHHGDITVESEPNKGAVFNILLPTLKAVES
jgi:signal transduction histidine kinase